MSLNQDSKFSGSGVIEVSVRTTPFDIDEIVKQVLKEVAPLWTLERFVAVNPFMAFTSRPLSELALKMERWLGADVFPTVDFYRQRHASGLLTSADLSYAATHQTPSPKLSLDRALTVLKSKDELMKRKGAHKDCRLDKLVATNAAQWLSSLFAQTGAVWQVNPSVSSFYSAWQSLVVHDYSLDIEGLRSLRKVIKKMSSSPQDVFHELATQLSQANISKRAVLRRLSYRNYAWLSYARFLDREAGREDDNASLAYQVLAIQAAYELALWRSGARNLASPEPDESTAHGQIELERVQLLDLYQEAAERGARRPLLESFIARKMPPSVKDRPRLQAMFCIDARSEIYRRNLESLSNEVQSIGFAGFFGLTLGSESSFASLSSRCPVLLKPSFEASLSGEEKPNRYLAKLATTAKKAISTTFSYVEAFGLFYLPLLIRDIFFAPRPVDDRVFTETKLTLLESKQSLPTETKVMIVKSILKHSGLRSRMGRLVLLCGHGSSSLNNPHASGLDCGACGGHRGDINAIAAAAILNDGAVREALKGTQFEIPMDTYFIAGLHNTTTGTVTLYSERSTPASHLSDVAELKRLLALASDLSLKERAISEHWPVAASLAQKEADTRSSSIGEVRPEWGLAKNAFFIAARRESTRGMNLGGRSFLHDYDHATDDEGATLELILTAPLVVAHWINMQYYASTVDNQIFGSGSKLLHSAVGSFGVIEGVDSNLRVGLPWQSVHDGRKFVHDPLRLQVFVEAPPAAIDRVLRKHGHIADLVVNKWITLVTIASKGETPQRCLGAGLWSPEL